MCNIFIKYAQFKIKQYNSNNFKEKKNWGILYITILFSFFSDFYYKCR